MDAYLTPPYPSPEDFHRGVTPPTRPRSGGDASRWHPYTSRFRSSTPTAGLRPSRSSESVPLAPPSRQGWPHTKCQYLYPVYEPTYQYTPPDDRRPVASTFYVTPDPSPVRYSHKHSYSVPLTIDRELAASRLALYPTPPRSRNASVEFDGAASIPFCSSTNAPHLQSIFVRKLSANSLTILV
jgi:hypothetical protein